MTNFVSHFVNFAQLSISKFTSPGDSEDTDEIVQPLNDTSPQEADNHISPPRSFGEPAVPFTSYSTHSHRQPRSTKNTSESERPPQKSADFGRAPTRHASQERQDEFDTRSFSSHQSSKKPKQVRNCTTYRHAIRGLTVIYKRA